MKYRNLFLLCVVLCHFWGCERQAETNRQTLDLSGEWQFATDITNTGIRQKWFLTDFPESIVLPGTMDQRGKGFLNHDTTALHLNRVIRYEGPAWYRKKLTLPESFRNQSVRLVLERTKSAKVWVDGAYAGESHLLQSPQSYDLTSLLSPGEHTLTLRIDNDLRQTPYGNVHIYSDDTQTNWNGILGDLYLEAAPGTHISDLQVYPDTGARKIRIRMRVENRLDLKELDVRLHVTRMTDGREKNLKTVAVTVPCDSMIPLEVVLGDAMDCWDDYRQPLYRLTAVIGHGDFKDSRTVPFGMRQFSAGGTQFAINGRTVFLRGKHDACVFPLTGHPPMEPEGWERYFGIVKSWGLNHVRFHSWCPPEAAFEAADRTGIFLQPELPFWGGLESDSTAMMLKAEGLALLKSYANHPSFVLFSPGNEIWSGHDRVTSIIRDLKTRDPRPLYTMGSNNNIGYVGPGELSDFHVAVRTPSDGDTIKTHVRLAHGFVDSHDGGILNTQEPSTDFDYAYPVSQISVPLVSHEMGQYQVYPDYREIAKYTGVLRAWNLEKFRSGLEKAGMLDQNADFTRASGAWSALCYKAEMEAALRTPGFAGFQLLDLQDFPGQGTALVGMLDAFMEDKHIVRRETWLQSCNDAVVLLRFAKYCWTQTENFQARVQVVNYSNQTLSGSLDWELVNAEGGLVSSGRISDLKISGGGIFMPGEIRTSLASVEAPQKLTVRVRLQNSGIANAYPLWVYPATVMDSPDPDIVIAERLDQAVLSALARGEKVLLFPAAESVQENSVGGLFPPDFWNYGMFKGISEWAGKPVSPGTLGILTNPEHPLFNSFPSEYHTNWQWWSIIRASRPLILNQTEPDYRPIVQVIDNLERNDKLGLIFEFRAGPGSLLVCMSRLNEILDRPEAKQLYDSMIRYMKSADFDPVCVVDGPALSGLFR